MKSGTYKFWIEKKYLEIEVFSFEIGLGGRSGNTCYPTKVLQGDKDTSERAL